MAAEEHTAQETKRDEAVAVWLSGFPEQASLEEQTEMEEAVHEYTKSFICIYSDSSNEAITIGLYDPDKGRMSIAISKQNLERYTEAMETENNALMYKDKRISMETPAKEPEEPKEKESPEPSSPTVPSTDTEKAAQDKKDQPKHERDKAEEEDEEQDSNADGEKQDEADKEGDGKDDKDEKDDKESKGKGKKRKRKKKVQEAEADTTKPAAKRPRTRQPRDDTAKANPDADQAERD